MLEIRIATALDYNAIAALWDEAMLPPVSRIEWDALISGPSANVLIAEDHQGLAGAAVASFDGWRAYIYHVAVDPGSRHNGVATALIREAEARLTRKGARAVFVMVHEANTAGLALIAAQGYLPSMGELVLSKELSEPVSVDVGNRRRSRMGGLMH